MDSLYPADLVDLGEAMGDDFPWALEYPVNRFQVFKRQILLYFFLCIKKVGLWAQLIENQWIEWVGGGHSHQFFSLPALWF